MVRAMQPALDDLGRSKVLFIFRGLPRDAALLVAEAVSAAGFTHLEFTSDSPGMPGLISAARGRAPRLAVGAGTVLDIATLEAAIAEGAGFLVSPHTDPALIEASERRGIPFIPGAFTATEVLLATRSGASAVKLFPATSLGVHGLADLRGPFPRLRAVPTGGIPVEEIPRWLAAGAFAVGAGRTALSRALGRDVGDRPDAADLAGVLARLHASVAAVPAP